MEPTLAYQSGRLDRHVRRGYVRLREEASRSRISYWIEEALRLAQLPQEDEGRIYCFRRVDFSGISSEANRRTWIVSVQNTLSELAARAVHASDPNADSSNAVYFDNREETLEMLLRRALRSHGTELPWYSASLLGIGSNNADDQIPIIVDQLFSRDATAYLAVAAGAAEILFGALEGCDPVVLLSAIAPERLREWVRELDRAPAVTGDLSPIRLPEKLASALRRAVSFGRHDPGVVWLAAQAVVSVAPSTLRSGNAVRYARQILRELAVERPVALPDASANQSANRIRGFDDEDTRVENGTRISEHTHIEGCQKSEAAPNPRTESAPENVALIPALGRRREQSAELTPAASGLRGVETNSAGLYFLLNAIRRVGIVTALKACPALAANDLVSHILKQLAVHVGVDENDPILGCLQPMGKSFSLSAEELSDLRTNPACLPLGFAPNYLAKLDGDPILRIWVLAVRRWCWRAGRLTVKYIVHRKGWVWLTRTDLDVTLPYEGADIRIRRIGLDIDPGWLPWLGLHGKVVRFHYRDPETR